MGGREIAARNMAADCCDKFFKKNCWKRLKKILNVVGGEQKGAGDGGEEGGGEKGRGKIILGGVAPPPHSSYTKNTSLILSESFLRALKKSRSLIILRLRYCYCYHYHYY